ncbi:hypothetical protein B6U67_00735 [Methanosarcinales archaeon ex4484_138]|nr:MAG: hypothetical protein B6U67_00735 [Methanosarcinales archaeon ex4484_138]
MDEIWRETFLFWSETEEYQKKVKEVKKNVQMALNRFRKPYVSFSGGKDSTVMLHLVLEQKPDVMVFHWDYGRYFIPREIEREFLNNAQKIGARNIVVKSSSLYEKKGRGAQNVLGRVMIGLVVPQLKKEGYDGCFVGLRAEEASRRNARTKNLFESGIITSTFPIRHLTWKDVWAYIVSNNLPYPSVYDKYAKVLGWDKVRLVTFFDPEFDKFGSPNIDGILMSEFRNVKR